MKRFAHITNGVVVNISEALTDADSHGGVECSSDVAIGWTYSAGVFSVPPVSEAERVAGIKAQLAHLDLKSIRALREGDSVRLVIIEQQILVLRAKL